MKVIVKRPGEKARWEEIENSLAALQEVVGGYIETVTFATDKVLICNEEGKIRGLPYNFIFLGCHFFGTVIFAGVKDDEFTDYPGDIEVLFNNGGKND